MSYTPTVWKDGDVVTSARLNKIEEGIETLASNPVSSFDLSDRIAKGVDTSGNAVEGAIVEGLIEDKTITNPDGSTFTMLKNKATGEYSHAEGAQTTASRQASHAEGVDTTASGIFSHAEGVSTTASGDDSHAEGFSTTASGNSSHAEGASTTASSTASHAEGYNTTASVDFSHAEGTGTTASGAGSHAEGGGTTASGSYSHADGFNTIAKHHAQHVFGEFNIEDPSSNISNQKGTYIEIVGNGLNLDSRSNARTLDWQGNEWINGSYSANGGLTLGKGTADEVTITAAQLKQLLAMLS